MREIQFLIWEGWSIDAYRRDNWGRSPSLFLACLQLTAAAGSANRHAASAAQWSAYRLRHRRRRRCPPRTRTMPRSRCCAGVRRRWSRRRDVGRKIWPAQHAACCSTARSQVTTRPDRRELRWSPDCPNSCKSIVNRRNLDSWLERVLATCSLL